MADKDTTRALESTIRSYIYGTWGHVGDARAKPALVALEALAALASVPDAAGPKHIFPVADPVSDHARSESCPCGPVLAATTITHRAFPVPDADECDACGKPVASSDADGKWCADHEAGGIEGPLYPSRPAVPDAARQAEALRNLETAAREVDAAFGGNYGKWTFDRKPLSEEAAIALLSMHDYLNDLSALAAAGGDTPEETP